MSLTFRLRPEAIRSQNAAMIEKLLADNEAIRAARIPLNGFINDSSQDSRTFRNLKELLEVYRDMGDAFMLANEADIADCMFINGAVGHQDLDGPVISGGQETARAGITWAEGRVAHYERLRSQAIQGGDWGLWNRYNGLVAVNNNALTNFRDRLTYWQRQEELYYEIEQATSGKFVSGQGLRERALKGKPIIAGAVSSAPFGFNKNAISSWLTDLNNMKETVQAATGDVINQVAEKLHLGETTVNALIGDPVNAATGNYIYKRIDLTIKGHMPLNFQRFYNSKNYAFSPLGRGWSHNYEIYLQEERKGVSIYYGSDGHSEFFERKKNESKENENTEGENKEEFISSETNNFSTLVRTKENGYIQTTKEGSTYRFDGSGMLVSLKDRFDNETVLTYTEHKLVKVSTVSGELTFTYDGASLVSVADHTGRILTFTYENNLLSSSTNPAGDTYTYTYDERERLKEIINPEGNRIIDNTFDENSRATLQIFPDGGFMEYRYDDKKKITEFVNQMGLSTSYKKDGQNQTTIITYPDKTEEETTYHKKQKIGEWDRLDNRTSFSKYDDYGNLISVTNALDVETQMEYNENHQLTKLVVDGQEKLTISYDKQGNAVAIEDGLKQKSELSYLDKGVIEKVIQPDGSELTLAYDERNNITELVNPLGIVTKYKYDDLNRVITSIDGKGNETHYAYDSKDNITAVKNALADTIQYSYNKNNKVTQVIDFDGSIIKREYNELNKLEKTIDQLGRETGYYYDKMWNLSQLVDANGTYTYFTYNQDSRLEEVTKGDKGTLTFSYDAVGNRTGMTDEEGNHTIFVYDALNRLTNIYGMEEFQLNYTYDSDGNVTCITDGMNQSVYLTYDNNGQLLEETNQLGEKRTYTYTSLGKIEAITDEAGRITAYTYKLGGQLTSILFPDGTLESYTYDQNGNVETYTNQIGVVYTYTYDALNRVIKITTRGRTTEGTNEQRIETAETHTKDSALETVKEYTYDAVSNVTSMTDELGNVISYEYTPTGKLAKVTDALGNLTLYSYDNLDKLVEVVSLGAESIKEDEDLQQAIQRNAKNQTLHITKYERDKMGRVTGVIDALGQKETYRYDLKGQLIEKLDKDDYLTKYAYTGLGDLKTVQFSDNREVKMSYNPLRQLTQVEDWLGITQMELDPLGRVTKVTNHQGKEIGYEWGALNEKRAITYPDGRKVSYEYDQLLRLTKVDDGVNPVEYLYNEEGNLIQKAFLNGTKTTYGYDPMGRLEELCHFKGEGLLDHYQYQYDLASNKTKIIKNRQNLSEDTGVFEYGYDPLNRLQEVIKDGNALRSYSYDGFGNRTALRTKESTTNYTYNALNQLISMADSQDIQHSYIYDKRGNLTQTLKNNQPTQQYHFGALNYLERVVNHESQLGATYRYNGLGHRVSRTEGQPIEPILPTATLNLENLSLNPTKQVDDVLDLTRRYHNLLQREENQELTSFTWDSNVLSATGINQNSYQYFQDELGSPVRFADVNGTVQEVYGYDEFGNEVTQNYHNIQPFTYTGYQRDSGANTYYAQARQYAPEQGRFISQDAYWGPGNMIYRDVANNPSQLASLIPSPLAIIQSGNLYSYGVNNALRYIDPTGFSIEDVDVNVNSGLPMLSERQLDTLKHIGSNLEHVMLYVGYHGALRYNPASTSGWTRVMNASKPVGRIAKGLSLLLALPSHQKYFDRMIAEGECEMMAWVYATGYVGSSFYGGVLGMSFGALWGPLAIIAIPVFGTIGAVTGPDIFDTVITGMRTGDFSGFPYIDATCCFDPRLRLIHGEPELNPMEEAWRTYFNPSLGRW